MSERGALIVVSGPSGCGKGTILSEILKDEKNYYSVSATTRQPRDGEVDGVNYHFISHEQFNVLISNGEMLEYAEYCGNYYGTPSSYVNKKLSEGKNVILEIEVQGAMKVKQLRPDATFVFILPPSMAVLRHRLEKRQTEKPEVIESRLEKAMKEIPMAKEYDFILVNNSLEDAVNDFKAIITAVELSIKNNLDLIDEVLEK